MGFLDAPRQAPALIVPPLSTLQTVSATAWPTANLAIFQRFALPVGGSFRYYNVRLDGSSGNYQYGVVRLSGAGLTSYTRVMNSGVVAAPAAGDLHLDLGATALPAGDYAAFLWFDNTTATTRFASNSGIPATRLAAETSSLASGVQASGTVAWASARFLGGVTIERNI